MQAARRVRGFVLALPAVALTVVVGYLTVLTAAAWRATMLRRRRTTSARTPDRRFVVLIPAHDEEQLIGSTLTSLAALEYPKDLYTVHVVADNCSDATASIAAGHGVEVHERTDPEHPGKGPALEWLMARLRAAHEPHDALVFLDADTTAAPGFLSAVEAELTRGAEVVQAHYGVREADSSPAVAFRAAALAARNHLRPLGRVAIGGTAGLYGNGMAFDADAFRGRTWSDHLTEDAELQIDLLLDGTLVAFAPDAKVEAEMPVTLSASRTQHERWERGRLDLARRFVPELLRRTIVGGPAPRRAYLDAAMDQVVPPFSIVVAGTAAWSTVAVARLAATNGRAGRRRVALAGVLVTAQVAYVLSALSMVGAPTVVYRGLLAAPRMVIWKVALWARVLLRPPGDGWVRTARNAGARPPSTDVGRHG